jgi:hypothetical protein
MVSRSWSVIALVVLVVGGCSQVPVRPEKVVQPAQPVRGWEWATTIPEGVPRAESVPASVKAPLLAKLGVNLDGLGVVPASTQGAVLQISKVRGQPVRSFDDLRTAFLRVGPRDKVAVEVTTANQAQDYTALKFNLEPGQLRLLEQSVCADVPAIRLIEEGNPWVLVRDGGVRVKVMARAEQTKGLLQVVLGLTLLSGAPQQLPVEIRASCQGRSLRCLSTSETLDLLYGQTTDRPDQAPDGRCSFAKVSEESQYKLPVNYKRLERQAKGLPPAPAVAALPGMVYPGSPILGDARALSAFLLQRELYQPNGPQKVGWVMFAGEVLKGGGTVQLDLDFGNGVRRLQLIVPNS